jgi:hypothetical protein
VHTSKVTIENTPYTCTEEDILTSEKRAYLDSVLADSAAFFADTLFVTRPTGNLQLANRDCGVSGSTFSIPNELRNPGAADTDYVLFVTAEPTLGTTLAFAAACQGQRDTSGGVLAGTGRPIAGFANFSPARISIGDPGLEAIVRHEVTHALGFSSQLFGEYATSSTVSRTRQVTRQARYDITEIVLPGVVQAARDHFDCPGLTGAEVEDGGGDGTSGSHWEKTRFGSEFMTGTSSVASVYSAVTFNLLQDSGWYTFNADSALVTTNPWGRGLGCGFATESCVGETWSKLGVPYFCGTDGEVDTITAQTCGPNHYGKSVCIIRNYPSSLPPQFRYFSSPSVGGSSLVEDYCPLVAPSEACRKAAVSDDPAANDINAKVAAARGESFAASSRCYSSTLLKKDKTNAFVGIEVGTVLPSCHETACVGPNKAKIKVDTGLGASLGAHWYDCDGKVGPVYGDYTGEITCPEPELLCGGAKVMAWPDITAIVPEKVRRGGSSITIHGDSFTDITRVDVSGVDCTITKNEDTVIECDTQSGDYALESFVRVTNALGHSDSTLEGEVKVDGKLATFIKKSSEFLTGDCGGVQCWVFVGGGALILIFSIVICCVIRKKKKAAAKRRPPARANNYQEMQRI